MQQNALIQYGTIFFPRIKLHTSQLSVSFTLYYTRCSLTVAVTTGLCLAMLHLSATFVICVKTPGFVTDGFGLHCTLTFNHLAESMTDPVTSR